MKTYLGRWARSEGNPPLAALASALCLACAALVQSLPVSAQSGGLTLYRGEPKSESGVTFAGWGSGTVEEDKDVYYSGSESLKITTHGQFQGASIVLPQPVDLAPYIGNKNAYLEIAILPPSDSNQPGGASAASRMYGAAGPMGGSGSGRHRDMGYSGGLSGRSGQPGNGRGGLQRPLRLQNIRVLLVGVDGRCSEVLLPLDSATIDNGWKLVHIPIPAIPGLTTQNFQYQVGQTAPAPGDSTRIKALRLFGDAPAVLRLGLVRVVTDATPLSVTPLDEQIVPRNERVRYTVMATAGVMPLAFSWDFDESDGIQDEAHGRSVVHSYLKAGDFIATVTVSDLYGLHTPQVLKIKIHVTP